jgi:metallophosphoesterase (TIGR00282 family)
VRILFLGDLVGRAGRDAVVAALPGLRRTLALDLVVVNGENASHGFGLSPDMARALLAAGADCITLGNHAWDRKEIIPYIEGEPRLLRPLNFPPGTPGRGSAVIDLPDGRRALVMNAMGRLFMEALDDPFRGTQQELARHRLGAGGTVQAAVMDFHAEASSEKMAFGHSFDGRLSLVVGTHTHTPSADHMILPGGTAYMTDAGMCGDYDSVIGMQKGTAALRFWKKVPGERLAPAEGEATICGVFVETEDATGLARRIAPLRMGGRLEQVLPAG